MSNPRMPAPTKAEIIKLLKEGLHPVTIAYRCNVEAQTVRNVAKLNGIKYSKIKRGANTNWRTGDVVRPVAPPVVEDTNWAGKASNLRWNRGWGGNGW